MNLPRNWTTCSQWILWKLFPKPGSDKFDKIPVDVTGSKMVGKDSTNWMTFETALKLSQQTGFGLGFQFSDLTYVCGIDLDGCRDIHTGVIEPWAIAIIEMVSSYTEISPSGTGLHIICLATINHTGVNTSTLEMYSKDRFFTVTGQSITPVIEMEDRSGVYEAILTTYQSQSTAIEITGDLSTEPVPGANPVLDDDLLIKKMLSGKSVAAKFEQNSLDRKVATPKDLWTGNTTVLGRAYPHVSKPFDHSAADSALMFHLAFYTGNHGERMEKLFGQSALGQRDKWIKRKAYRYTTIIKVCAGNTKFFKFATPKVPPPPPPTSTTVIPPPPVDVKGEHLPGLQLVPVEQQIQEWKDFAYVQDCNKIIDDRGVFHDQSQFNNIYGNREFAFDSVGDKWKSEPWKVFTNSQAYKFQKVHHTTFRPDIPPRKVIMDALGHKNINVYVPAIVPSVPGDVTRFTNHIARLLPNLQDQLIVLSYLAACVQYIGEKFRWAPLIQGAPGNGKSLIGECMKAAIGKVYTHSPLSEDISNKFNSWLEGKLLIIVEEVNVKGKYELMEVLKPMITSDDAEVQPKGVDKKMADVCCNFLMFSNHKDGLIKTKDDRRHAIFYCAQQSVEDILRDGMDDVYFDDIFNWLKGGGFANVTHFLQNYEIPAELNPAMRCNRAPETSSTSEAIQYSLGPVEEAIQEAMTEEIPGFMGGWVSSVAISKLIDKAHKLNKPLKHRVEMMRQLGYILHPGLKNGRASTSTMIDGGKRPKLYVLKDTIQANMPGNPSTITASYLRAQGVADSSEIKTDQEISNG